MVEKDLVALLVDSEVRQFRAEKIAMQDGWAYDLDGWPQEESRLFLKLLLAYDLETRDDYLEFVRNSEKRREYGAENVADAELDQAFFERSLGLWYERGERVAAKKAAAIYFADANLRRWYCDVWLNDEEEWRYVSSRDDVFLAEILSNDALRPKAPDVVQRAFIERVLPMVTTLSFSRAKRRFGYNVEDYFCDVYLRVFGRGGRRKEYLNGVDFWRKTKPTSALLDWIALEAYRTIHCFLQRERRAETGKLLAMGDKIKRGGANAADFDENETPFDMQTFFDEFAAKFSTGAYLIASNLCNGAKYADILGFWNIGREAEIDANSLGQRYRRTLDGFRLFCEKKLALGEIDKAVWQEIAKEIKKDARTDDKPAQEEEKTPNYGRAPKSKNWFQRVRFLPERKPTEEEATLLRRVLENRRLDEAGFEWRYLRKKTHGGEFRPSYTLMPVRRQQPMKDNPDLKPPYCSVQNPYQVCGAPVLVDWLTLNQKTWRNKYAESVSFAFYFESKEAFSSPTYWQALVRIPYNVDAESEIGVVVDWRDKFNVAPVEFSIGETTAAVVRGVAKFRIDDFRAGIENGLLGVTMKIRCLDGKWHTERFMTGRLLFRKPVVRDNESR